MLQPLLFMLPPHAARKLTLAVLAGVARTPGGSGLIDFLGHMRPDADSRARSRAAADPSTSARS